MGLDLYPLASGTLTAAPGSSPARLPPLDLDPRTPPLAAVTPQSPRSTTLGLAECWRLYLPLGLTFLMVSGADPVVTTGLRHIGTSAVADQALASYLLAFSVQLFVHSPLFVTREIVITLARDQQSYGRARRFLLAFALPLTAVDLMIALTPVGDAVLGSMTLDPAIVPDAKAAMAVMSIHPVLIARRGIDQALLIRNDRSRWVGLSTAARLAVMVTLVLVVVHWYPGLGAVGGAISFALGITTETLLAFCAAARDRAALPPGPRHAPRGSVATFALPLMLSNLVGLTVMPVCVAIAGTSLWPVQDIAGFGLVRTLAITIGSPVFALRALVTAKATTHENRMVLARFAVHAGLVATTITALVTHPTISDVILVRLLNAPGGSLTTGLTLAALPMMMGMPMFIAARATMGGVLISRRSTGWVLAGTISSLVPLLGVLVYVRSSPVEVGRATIAYGAWIAAFATDCGVQALVLWFTSGGRRGALP